MIRNKLCLAKYALFIRNQKLISAFIDSIIMNWMGCALALNHARMPTINIININLSLSRAAGRFPFRDDTFVWPGRLWHWQMENFWTQLFYGRLGIEIRINIMDRFPPPKGIVFKWWTAATIWGKIINFNFNSLMMGEVIFQLIRILLHLWWAG